MKSNPLQAFVDAFNDRDLERLRAELVADAVAHVVGAPFPLEEGRDVIARTSLPYLLEAGLVAQLVDLEGTPGIALLIGGAAGPIDVFVRVERAGGGICALAYLTAPHAPEELRAVGQSLGLRTPTQ